VAAVVVLPGVAERAWDEFRGPETGPSNVSDPASRLTSLSGNRHNLWESALDAFQEQPWKGLGAGTYEFWWNRAGITPEHVRDAHSLYLEALAELGVLGLLAFLLISVGAFAATISARLRAAAPAERAASAAGIAAATVWLATANVDWIWEATANTVLAVLLVAAAVPTATTLRTSTAPRVVLVLLSLVAIAVQLPALASTSALRESQAAFRANDEEEARAAAADAISASPWAAAPYAQRALLHEAAGRLEAAAADVRRAARREPTNWRHPLLLARIEAERGRPKAALAAFERARRLRPLSSFFADPG
jgi:tetratricopeptide (TPR) repeat protein